MPNTILNELGLSRQAIYTKSDKDGLRKTASKTPKTWDMLVPHFRNKIDEKADVLIKETIFARNRNRTTPFEATMKIHNKNVYLVTNGATIDDNVFSFSCKNQKDGVDKLTTWVNLLEEGRTEVTQAVAETCMEVIGFNTETIPTELLTRYYQENPTEEVA